MIYAFLQSLALAATLLMAAPGIMFLMWYLAAHGSWYQSEQAYSGDHEPRWMGCVVGIAVFGVVSAVIFRSLGLPRPASIALGGISGMAILCGIAAYFEPERYRASGFWKALAVQMVPLLAPPAYIAVLVAKRWTERNASHGLLALEPSASVPEDECGTATVVVEEYLREIRGVRNDLLGPASEIQKSRAALAEQLASIRATKERIKQRLASVSAPECARRENLQNLLDMQAGREERIAKELDRYEKNLIPRLDASLKEVEAELAGVEELIIDERLAREVTAGKAEDGHLVKAARALTQRAIVLQANRLRRIVAATLPSGKVPAFGAADDPLDEYERYGNGIDQALTVLERGTADEDRTDALVSVL